MGKMGNLEEYLFGDRTREHKELTGRSIVQVGYLPMSPLAKE